jgi:hypothetical protein
MLLVIILIVKEGRKERGMLMSEYANKLIDNIVLAESINGQVDVTFGIDGDILDIYMGGWYVTSVNMGGLSAEARYEIGIDLNYDDSNNKGGKDGRPDRELYHKERKGLNYERDTMLL